MRHPHFCIEAVANSGVVLSGRALMSMVENTGRGAPPALYTCADDQNKCQTKKDTDFEKARQHDLGSKDKDVVRAAKAFGDPT
jgi:hypothetical protein